MSQSIIPFDFNSHTVRIVMRDGNPWFVAKDVMDALDYAETSNPARVTEHIPSEWKGVNPIHTLGGEQKLLCLAEPGLYFFLGRSDKPKALPFQKWLAGEVLPSIRKTGSYVSNDTVSLTTVRRCGTVAPALANSSAGFGNPMNGASRAPRIPSGAFLLPPTVYDGAVRKTARSAGSCASSVPGLPILPVPSPWGLATSGDGFSSRTETCTMHSTLPASVDFSDVSLTIIDHDGIPYLTAADLARALGYKDTSAVLRIYSRHTDEFTSEMSLTVNLTVKGFGCGNSEKPVRIFSPRGCHLVAMFARTSVAAAFRRWVLDVLEVLPSIRKTGEYTVNPDLEYDQMRGYSKDRKQMEELNTAHSRWISDVRRLLESAGIKEPEFPKGLEDSKAIATSALVELLRWHRWVLDFGPDFRLRLTPVTLHTNFLTSDEVADWVRHPTFPSKHLPDIAKAAIERMSKAFSEKAIGPHMEQAAPKVMGNASRHLS